MSGCTWEEVHEALHALTRRNEEGQDCFGGQFAWGTNRCSPAQRRRGPRTCSPAHTRVLDRPTIHALCKSTINEHNTNSGRACSCHRWFLKSLQIQQRAHQELSLPSAFWKSRKLRVRPYCSENASSTTACGSTLAPDDTTPRSSGFASSCVKFDYHISFPGAYHMAMFTGRDSSPETPTPSARSLPPAECRGMPCLQLTRKIQGTSQSSLVWCGLPSSCV